MIDCATFVTLLYLAFLHRAPDDAGLASWSSQCQSGAISQQQLIDLFSTSPEEAFVARSSWLAPVGKQGPLTDAAIPNEAPIIHYAVGAGYSGGTPGWASPFERLDMTVGPDAKDFRWGKLCVLTVQGGTDHVCHYIQVHVTGPGWGGGAVEEVRADVPGATAVAHEIDVGAVPGAMAVGLDFRDTGGTNSFIRVPVGTPAIRNSYDGSYITAIPGGFAVMSASGAQIAAWKQP